MPSSNQYGGPFSYVYASLTNPAGATVCVDTGQLAAGVYEIEAWATIDGRSTTANNLSLQYRNAANAANLCAWEISYSTSKHSHPNVHIPMITIAQNERLRWVNTAAPGAGFAVTCNILYRRIG